MSKHGPEHSKTGDVADKKVEQQALQTPDAQQVTNAGVTEMAQCEQSRTNKHDGSAGGGSADDSVAIETPNGTVSRANPLRESDLGKEAARHVTEKELREKAAGNNPFAADLVRQMEEARKLPEDRREKQLAKIQIMADRIFQGDKLAQTETEPQREILDTHTLANIAKNDRQVRTYSEVLKDVPPGADRERIKEAATDVVHGKFDNAYVDELLASNTGIDGRHRPFKLEISVNENTARKIEIEESVGHPIALQRADDGSFTSIKDGSGGQYRLDAKTANLLYERVGKDGATVSSHTNERNETIESRRWPNGERLEECTAPGAHGPQLLSRTYHDVNGTVTHDDFLRGQTVIREPNGFTTRIHQTERGLEGTRTDAQGRAVEDVTFTQAFMVRRDRNTGHLEYLFREPQGPDHHHSRLVSGEFDQNRSEFKHKLPDGSIETVSIDNPRKERVTSLGDREARLCVGEDGNGKLLYDYSKVTARGAIEINRHDGSGLRMDSDYTIQAWDAGSVDKPEQMKLSADEIRFLKDHPSADLRDVAEIHRRFHDRPDELKSFYEELAKIDTSKHLTKNEIDALRGNILHHVANPRELNQGATGNCSLSVTQRDLAINSPHMYAFVFAQVVNNNAYESQDGKHQKFAMNVDNWKQQDNTGRDLATRLFHNIGIQIEAHEQGLGLVTTDARGGSFVGNSETGQRIEFQGLLPGHVCDLVGKLTGENRSIVKLRSVDDLERAFKLSDGKPVILTVLQGSPPFGNNGHPEQHVVSLTGFDHGPPPRVAVQNEHGAPEDHSSPDTLLDANRVLQNMMQSQSRFDSQVASARRAHGVPLPTMPESTAIIAGGDGKSVFEFRNGQLAKVNGWENEIATQSKTSIVAQSAGDSATRFRSDGAAGRVLAQADSRLDEAARRAEQQKVAEHLKQLKEKISKGPTLYFLPGVTDAHKKGVEKWWNSLPGDVRKIAIQNKLHVVVAPQGTDIYLNAKTLEARRHRGESLATASGFYEPYLESLVLVEFPDRTQAGQKTEEKQKEQGVNIQKQEPKSASLEKVPWHEFGHALDFKVLKHVSKSAEFDQAFHQGLKKVPPELKFTWRYYIEPEMTKPEAERYTAAKEELFAEIFMLRNKQNLTQGDQKFLDTFSAFADLMERKKLFPPEKVKDSP